MPIWAETNVKIHFIVSLSTHTSIGWVCLTCYVINKFPFMHSRNLISSNGKSGNSSFCTISDNSIVLQHQQCHQPYPLWQLQTIIFSICIQRKVQSQANSIANYANKIASKVFFSFYDSQKETINWIFPLWNYLKTNQKNANDVINVIRHLHWLFQFCALDSCKLHIDGGFYFRAKAFRPWGDVFLKNVSMCFCSLLKAILLKFSTD